VRRRLRISPSRAEGQLAAQLHDPLAPRPRPARAFQVDAPAAIEANSLRLEQPALRVGPPHIAAQADPAGRIEHTLPRNNAEEIARQQA